MILTAALLSLAFQDSDLRRPFLSPIFSDHMVLQLGKPNAFWGWTDPGKKVTVAIAGKSGVATADSSGKWMVRVMPPKVGGPYQVKVSGPESVTLSDVLVGDVWICGGQSNMQYGVDGVLNGPAEVAAANHPNIRFSMVPTRMSFSPYETTPAPWKVCSPTTIGGGEWNGLSAVGYFFAREMEKKLGVPIGLVHDCRGGSSAESWVSRATLDKLGSLNESLGRIDLAKNTEHAEHGAAVEKWLEATDPGSKNSEWAQPDFDDRAWNPVSLPGGFMKAVKNGYPGVVWFRTEIELPESALARDITLRLGKMEHLDWAFVNGTAVGKTYTPGKDRAYVIPTGLLKPGKNVIAIRTVDMGGSDVFLSKESSFALVGADGKRTSLASQKWRVQPGPNFWMGKTEFPWGVEASMGTPTIHYNAMISPVAPLTVRGAIWYQGETNVGRSRQYIEIMQKVASDWRASFRTQDLPFFQVQLANYLARATQPGESSWAALREAQQISAGLIPGGGFVTAIDIGDPGDIHPKNKQDVGLRLARLALNKVFGRADEHGQGPMKASFRVEGNALRVEFSNIVGGLMAKGGDLKGFSVAGADRKFHWAKAVIYGNAVVLTCPEVPNPVAARYAWADNPETTLFDKNGLPAFPFRTDDWPVY